MEKRVVELNMDHLNRDRTVRDTARDSLARQAAPQRVPGRSPEIKPAPRKGVRIHSQPLERSKVRPGWILAIMAVAMVYICLVGQYMTMTELSLEASSYKSTIKDCENEISKLKKASMTKVDDATMDDFIRANDMDKLLRSDVEYLDLNREEVIINYEDRKLESTAKEVLSKIKEGMTFVLEFFR